MNFDPIDILVFFNVAASALTLPFSATKNDALFRRVIGAASFLQMITGVVVLVLAVRSQTIGGILLSFGEAATGGRYIVGWLATLGLFVFYVVAFAKILPSGKRGYFPGYSLHRFTFFTTAFLTFVVFPVISAAIFLFLKGGTLAIALQAASVWGIGYGSLFLRLDLVRILALSSFAHRNAPMEDPGAMEEKWNWWAFVFGVRWYFSRGLLLPGFLMMIPYIAALVPGLPGSLLMLAFLGTRLYAGFRGNHDYRKLRGVVAVGD